MNTGSTCKYQIRPIQASVNKKKSWKPNSGGTFMLAVLGVGGPANTLNTENNVCYFHASMVLQTLKHSRTDQIKYTVSKLEEAYTGGEPGQHGYRGCSPQPNTTCRQSTRQTSDKHIDRQSIPPSACKDSLKGFACFWFRLALLTNRLNHRASATDWPQLARYPNKTAQKGTSHHESPSSQTLAHLQL
jgi:hypothetical protein